MRLGVLPYPQAVKDRAVEMYWSDPTASCASVAREVGCSEESVRRWVHAAGPQRTDPSRIDRDEQNLAVVGARLARLEATIAELERKVAVALEAPSSDNLHVLF